MLDHPLVTQLFEFRRRHAQSLLQNLARMLAKLSNVRAAVPESPLVPSLLFWGASVLNPDGCRN